ncbi:MAG TPA: response regulator transcription factor [Acidimicrobiia bacterium]|nr:response regulator transcription factor [Acidimicrobiia bacterium]
MLIADDHAVFRRGLHDVLAAVDDLEIVGEASDGTEVVDRVNDLLPDVVLMDLNMPAGGGIEATRRIRSSQPATRIIMLTVSDSEDDLSAAVRAGASAYLLKEVPIEELADAVRSVARGNGALAPAMVPKLFNEFNVLARRVEEHAGGNGQLTDRELEVLRLVARGLSNKDIAAELVIAQNTVKNHMRNILEKLQARSRVEAAMVAVRDKLIESP